MISADFAPNEAWDDAWTAFKMLLRPWSWKKGKYFSLIKRRLKSFFPEGEIFLFLTGRGALYQLLRALNLPQGTEVLVQAFTCEAAVLPILGNHLKPVYVDIEEETYSINLEDLKKKITDKSKVLILQHTFGLIPKNRDAILSLAKQHKLFIIEDLAHGFNHNNLTTKQFNNRVILLSFGRSKALSSVFGGALVVGNKKIAEKLRSIERGIDQPSNLFILKSLIYKPLSLIIKSTYSLFLGKVIHKVIKLSNLLPAEISTKEKRGEFDNLLNKGYPNAFAYLLHQQLKKFEQIQTQRAKICDIYQCVLNNFKPSVLTSGSLSLLRYPLLVNDRDRVLRAAKKLNIFLGNWYCQPVAPKQLNLNKVGYRSGSCPIAEKLSQEIINLPTFITQKQAHQVIKILNDVTSINQLIEVE